MKLCEPNMWNERPKSAARLAILGPGDAFFPGVDSETLSLVGDEGLQFLHEVMSQASCVDGVRHVGQWSLFWSQIEALQMACDVAPMKTALGNVVGKVQTYLAALQSLGYEKVYVVFQEDEVQAQENSMRSQEFSLLAVD